MMLSRRICNNFGRLPLKSIATKFLLPEKAGNTPQLSLVRLSPLLRRNIQQARDSSAAVHATKVLWNKLFGKYLLATNTISSGLLMVIGDLMAQEIEYRRTQHETDRFDIKRDRYDLERVGRMFIVGALQGPLHHYVYKWMDRAMPLVNFRNIMKKILIDQLFMSPACILIFFYGACYMEKKSLADTNKELCDKFPIIYLMDWTVWPAAQYVNFRYLHTKYRVVFVNVCTALYNVFMSYMKHDF